MNAEGAIRFGLGAMSGVGEGAVQSIIENRKEATYEGIFDFATKVNLKDCNKRVFEALAQGGAFDDLPKAIFRAQCFAPDVKGRTTIELAIRYGKPLQESGLIRPRCSAGSLAAWTFPAARSGGGGGPPSTSWRAKRTSSASTSPALDEFKVQLDQWCTPGGCSLDDLATARGPPPSGAW